MLAGEFLSCSRRADGRLLPASSQVESCVCLCPDLLFLSGPRSCGIKDHRVTPLYLNHLFKGPSLKTVTSEVLGVGASVWEFRDSSAHDNPNKPLFFCGCAVSIVRDLGPQPGPEPMSPAPGGENFCQGEEGELLFLHLAHPPDLLS